MAKKWELPEKTFDKGRRPRRHLTRKGQKALRHLRLALVLVAIFFAMLFASVLQDRSKQPNIEPQDANGKVLR